MRIMTESLNKSIVPPEDKLLVRAAAHEAGHGVAAWQSCYVSDIDYIQIWDNGRGITSHKYYRYSEDLLFPRWEQIVVGLAGIAGELHVFGRVNPKGCLPDFQVCCQLAKGAAARVTMAREKWGIPNGTRLVHVTRLLGQEQPDEIGLVLDLCLARAKALIAERASRFRKLQRRLIGRHYLTNVELSGILGRVRDSF